MDKDQIIKDLEEKLSREKAVKRSEVIMNIELLARVEKYQLHIETLLKINEEYSNKIGELRSKLKKLIVE
jgi:chaperonin cofactor prefoldin